MTSGAPSTDTVMATGRSIVLGVDDEDTGDNKETSCGWKLSQL